MTNILDYIKLHIVKVSIIVILIILIVITGIHLRKKDNKIIDNEISKNSEITNQSLVSITRNEEDDNAYYYNACIAKMYEEIEKQYSTEKLNKSLSKITGIKIENKEKSNRFLVTAGVFNDNGNNYNLTLYNMYKSNPNKYSSASYIEKLIVGHDCMAIIEIDSIKLKELYEKDKIHNNSETINEETKDYLSTIKNIEFINLSDYTMERLINYSNYKKEYVDRVNEELKRVNWIGEYLSLDNNNVDTSNQFETPQNNSSSYDENMTDINEEQLNGDTSFNNYPTDNFQTSNSGNSNYEQNSSSNNYNSSSSSNGNNDYYGNDNNGSNGNDNYNNQPQQPQEKNIEMPNVVGMSVSQAEQKLNSLGIPYNVTSVTSLSKDNVFSQSVPSGTSKPKSQFGTVTLKAYRKVSVIVRVRVNVISSDESKRMAIVGKNVAVTLNGVTQQDNSFNGDGYSCNFLDVTNNKVSVNVNIGNTLTKSQEFDIESLVQNNSSQVGGNTYVDLTINIQN